MSRRTFTRTRAFAAGRRLLPALVAIACGAIAHASPVLPKTDANDGLNGDNPFFQRWNVARACSEASGGFWYTSVSRLPSEPDPSGEQWVDYRPPLSILGPGRYRITATYRRTGSRAGYDALYIIHHAGGTTTIPHGQFGYLTESVTLDLGDYDLAGDGWVRLQDIGSGSVAFGEMRFTYLGPSVDHEPPSVPVGVQAAAISPSSVRLTWAASTDNVGVTGYRIFRDGWLAGTSVRALYTDTSLAPTSTCSYTVSAFDAAGNESARSSPPTQATTEPASDIVFDFDDQGSSTIAYASSPNTFSTSAKGNASYWFGRKNVANDGSVYWGLTSGSNNYRFSFAESGGVGSLAIQTATPQGQSGSLNGSAYVGTNNLGDWFRWTKDGDYCRGVMIEADMAFVGDSNGWCAAYPPLPAIAPCSWSSDYLHQGSDWGSISGNRSMLYVSVQKNLDLTEPGMPAGSGATGDGVAYWISAQPGLLADSSDDRVRLQSHTYNYDHGTFRLKDGLGLGLSPENGTASGCRDAIGAPYPRNGIIEGSCNRIKLAVGLLNAGGNDDYFDIWLTRPDGTRIHIDPISCDWIDSDENLPNKAGFGADGHTLRVTYSNKDNTKSIIRLGCASTNGLWGVRYDRIRLRNDWSGRVETRVSRLADLRSLPVGTPVSIEGMAVTTITQSADGLPPFFFYAQEPDRTAGIRVLDRAADPQPVRGSTLSTSGVLLRDASGNLCIDATGGHCAFRQLAEPARPMALNGLSVCLGGPDVTGLLVTVWGTVVSAGTDPHGNSEFTLSDGSPTPTTCRDYAYDGTVALPMTGEYWTATGVPVRDTSGVRYVVVGSARRVE